MSPTVFRFKSYRFFFFSREENRIHIHVSGPEGEAKFWLEPQITLAKSYGLSSRELKEVEEIIRERKDEIAKAWKEHFGG